VTSVPAVRDASSVTWVGHATVRYDLGGTRVITDPLLTGRVAHLRRRVPPPPSTIGDVDLVLVSHAHMDHLHVKSLAAVVPTATIVVPRGLASVLRSLDRQVIEMCRGDVYQHGAVTVEAVHAEHSGGRGPHTRASGDPLGFVIEGAGVRAYFPGDTDLFEAMSDLGDIDIATIPIWGWGPTLGTGHLDPTGAVEAVRRVQPDVVIPMHWGTYSPENGRRGAPAWFRAPLERFEQELLAAGLGDRLQILEPGGVLRLDRPTLVHTPADPTRTR
jgi:L-ascorbate metabolism protein UlaG (beta-lactamase superfamily)